MGRRLVMLVLVAAWTAGSGCKRNPGNLDAAGDQPSPVPAIQADPMSFVLLHQGDLQRIIENDPNDCEGTLAALLRFVADRREDYRARVQSKPAHWLPEGSDPDAATGLLMRFAERCPGQVARVNEAIHHVSQ